MLGYEILRRLHDEVQSLGVDIEQSDFASRQSLAVKDIPKRAAAELGATSADQYDFHVFLL
jgi:hypothetical protein